MLRLALIYMTETGVGVCAPLHDAIFAVAPASQEEWAVANVEECMERAAVDSSASRFLMNSPSSAIPTVRAEQEADGRNSLGEDDGQLGTRRKLGTQ